MSKGIKRPVVWKSLQVSYQHWMAGPLSDEIKEQIKEYYWDYRHLGADKVYDLICSIVVKKCEICGHNITVGERTCPNINLYINGSIRNKHIPYDQLTNEQKAHKDNTLKIVKEAAKNKDYTYLIERNKSPEMRAISAETGKKTIKYALARKAELDGPRYCDRCKRITTYVCGIGCMRCHNMVHNHIEFCNKCGKRTMHAGKMCTVCHNKKVNHIEYCPECDKDTMHAGTDCMICRNKELNHEEFCESCRKITVHAGNLCLTCQAAIMRSYYAFYKTSEINDLSEYYRQSEYILSKNLKIQSYIDFIEWELGIKGIVVPTGIRMESDIWERKRKYFENNLVDLGVNYFVYAKLTKDKVLAVVGKSGSRNVNASGSDVNFSYHTVTGSLLNELGAEWDKTGIVLWHDASWTEDDAYAFEEKIGDALLKMFMVVNYKSHAYQSTNRTNMVGNIQIT